MDSESLKFWQSFSEWGFGLAIFVVSGKIAGLVAKWPAKCVEKRLPPQWMLPLNTFWGITLCVGLLMIFWGSHKAMQITGRQNAILHKAAAQAEKAAAQATERASTNELAARQLESQNLAIKKQLLELQAIAQWRTISAEQETNLINRLKPFTQANPVPPARVVVDLDGENPECLLYAKRIADVLTECGFDVEIVPSLRLSFISLKGLIFEVRDGLHPPAHAREITKAFNDLNIPVIAIGNTSVAADVLHILIMPKPDR